MPSSIEKNELNKESPNRWSGVAFKAVAALIILASFGIWAYGCSGKAVKQRLDRRTDTYRNDAADLLDDSTFGLQAELICEKAKEKVDELPRATQAKNQEDRANHVAQGTAIFETMMADLGKLDTATNRDKKIVTGWLEDWRYVLEDRQRYSNAVRTDPTAGYLMTDIDGQERIDKRINRLADTNDMESCGYPTDAG